MRNAYYESIDYFNQKGDKLSYFMRNNLNYIKGKLKNKIADLLNLNLHSNRNSNN